MNSPSEPYVGVRLERPWEPNSGKGTLDDYLDDFCFPLYDVMSVADVKLYRQLAEEHVLSLIEEFEAKGFPPHGAFYAALREHGDPALIGSLLQKEWLHDGSFVVESSIQRRARFFASVCAGVYSLLALLMWLLTRDSNLSIPIFLLTSVAVGMMAGCIAFFRTRRPVFWAVASILYPILLTTLILTTMHDLSATTTMMFLWLTMLLLVALRTWRFWWGQRHRENYRRFLA